MSTPSNFVNYPMCSVLQKAEAEQVASNIMIILRRTGDTFRPISWEEYKAERMKDHGFSDYEREWFDRVIEYFKSEDTARLFSPLWRVAP